MRAKVAMCEGMALMLQSSDEPASDAWRFFLFLLKCLLRRRRRPVFASGVGVEGTGDSSGCTDEEDSPLGRESSGGEGVVG